MVSREKFVIHYVLKKFPSSGRDSIAQGVFSLSIEAPVPPLARSAWMQRNVVESLYILSIKWDRCSKRVADKEKGLDEYCGEVQPLNKLETKQELEGRCGCL